MEDSRNIYIWFGKTIKSILLTKLCYLFQCIFPKNPNETFLFNKEFQQIVG